MLFEVILELNAKPDQSQVLKNWLETNLPDTQAFDGCAAVHALEHEENSSHIVLIGFWRSRKQWEQYFEWRKDRGDFETRGRIPSEVEGLGRRQVGGTD